MSLLFPGAEQYQFVAADPPWKHQNYGMKKHGAAKAHYTEMKLGSLCSLPISRMVAKDSLLGLWCLGTKEAEGAHIKVAKAWGFELRTRLLTWVKCYRRCTDCKRILSLERTRRDSNPQPSAIFQSRHIQLVFTAVSGSPSNKN